MIEPTIFVVDDDEAVRDSMDWLLESVGLPVEIYDSAESFLENYTIHRVGCLVLDIRMPGMSGLQLQEKLNEQPYSLPIIFITGHGDVPMAVRAMKSGAVDFVEKPFRDQDLLELIHNGLEVDKEFQQKRLRVDSVQARMKNLTRREKEVLDLVIEQHSNKKIAETLGVTIKTVEFHRARLMEKMHASSFLDLMEMVRETTPGQP